MSLLPHEDRPSDGSPGAAPWSNSALIVADCASLFAGRCGKPVNMHLYRASGFRRNDESG
jgi:hypothetical protein